MRTIPFSKLIPFVGSAFFFLIIAQSVRAATYYVAPTGNDSNAGTEFAPFRTIQKGINAAVNGDTVLVKNDTYSGVGNRNLTFFGKRITVRPTVEGGVCYIDGENTFNYGVRFSSGETAETVLDSFTFFNFKTNETNGAGAAGIRIEGASPTLRNCIVNQCKVTVSTLNAYGGGVSISNGSPTFTNCEFNYNSVTSSSGKAAGGGAYLGAGANATFTNCRFFFNNAISNGDVYGAGIAAGASGASLTLNNCTVEENIMASADSASLGGGVFLEQGTTGVLRGCTIIKNIARGDLCFGGGIATFGIGQEPVSLTVTDCDISNNTSRSTTDNTYGGGVSLSFTPAVFTRTRIASNLTVSIIQARGGGVSSFSSSPTFTDCTIASNVAESSTGGTSGGGFYINRSGLSASTVSLLRCTLTDNSLLPAAGRIGSGGGLYNDSCTLSLANCILTNNRGAGGDGGAMFAGTAVSTLTDCTFSGNSANFGGAIRNIASTLTVTNCLFTGNTAVTAGGAVYNDQNSPASLTNCVLSGNKAETAGGAVFGANITLLHCTLTGNRAASGGGVGVQGGTNFTATNSIIYGNTATTSAPNVNATGATAAITYSDVEGGFAGTGNINANPLFVRNYSAGADGVVATADDDFGDLRLQNGSPAINAANASAPNEPGFDFLYKARNAGGNPDMGAYESNSSTYIAANLYVDKVAGSDTTGTGTQSAPFKTVAKALTLTSTIFYTQIHIKVGNYGSDKPSVGQKVRFVNWTNTGRASIGKQ